MKLTKLFNDFFHSEKAAGLILLLCTAVSLGLTNSSVGEGYAGLWHSSIGGHTLTHWINDGLMTIFFLLIGLELEREVYIGELSDIKNALLPLVAAIGGMVVPASLHLLFNFNTPTQNGAGIPMATDIAFALGVLSLLGNRIPAALKVFLTALAVIDDLGAIIVIAVFYTGDIQWANLSIALSIFAVLLVLNRLRIHNLIPYLIAGIVMWYFMLNSGVHATISGVMLAFAIPFGDGSEKSPSYILQRLLHLPVAFVILPIFALANTSINLPVHWYQVLVHTNSYGIFAGLLIGKPFGISLSITITNLLGWTRLPAGTTIRQILGAGFLGGIGFTMSIFITLLAFSEELVITQSKIAIMIASTIAGAIGFIILRVTTRQQYEEE